MYNLYNRIFELNKNNTSGTTITFLMLSIAQEKRKKKFTDEQVLEKYDAISEVIDFNLQNKGKASDRWEDIQTTVDNLLGQIVKVDCDFVRTKMGETIMNKPEDIKTSKRAIKYMLSGKCTDDPLFLRAAENVFKVEPGYGLGLTIAKIYQSKQEMEKAISWREKVIPMANDNPADQAKLHYEIAQILSTQGKKSEARAKALKAVEVDNSVASDVYTLIGDLYYTSGGTCTDSDPIKARACYLAAYDMYQKAGNSAKMAAAREQFPSKTDIFTMTRQEGESLPVGCWIGGSTVIRARPSDN
jgi:tetratricopeptide (TPR) repeat protein